MRSENWQESNKNHVYQVLKLYSSLIRYELANKNEMNNRIESILDACEERAFKIWLAL